MTGTSFQPEPVGNYDLVQNLNQLIDDWTTDFFVIDYCCPKFSDIYSYDNSALTGSNVS